MDAVVRTAFQPKKPMNWRTKNCGCDHMLSWTYKRNYKVEVEDIDGDYFRYAIYEITDRDKPVTVLMMGSSKFPYDIKMRVEALVRIMAKGRKPKLNKFEKDLLVNSDGDTDNVYNEDNINFVPYQIA